MVYLTLWGDSKGNTEKRRIKYNSQYVLINKSLILTNNLNQPLVVGSEKKVA